MSKINRILILTFILFAWFLAPLSFAGDKGDAITTDIPILEPQSDLIVRGRVVKLLQGTRDTNVILEVIEVYKGDPEIHTVQVSHFGGKFQVRQDEPFFSSTEEVILFLEPYKGTYRCVMGKDGKKTVRNRNVYLHADNSFLTMKLKEYRKAINKVLEDQDQA